MPNHILPQIQKMLQNTQLGSLIVNIEVNAIPTYDEVKLRDEVSEILQEEKILDTRPASERDHSHLRALQPSAIVPATIP